MKTILVMDDEFDILEALKTILELEGYRVVACENGRQGLDYLAEVNAQLLVVDVMMPVLGGLEVLRALQGNPRLSSIPVILMSAIRPNVKREHYRWAAFLQKPFSLETLLESVQKLIGPPGEEESRKTAPKA